jgi:tRNA(Ile)-lysidine synthase
MTSADTGFLNERLMAKLSALPTPRKYWVGFSGGADSTALLQCLHECRERLPAQLHAIHFHHGLQQEAEAWQEHCRKFCDERNIPYHAEILEIDSAVGTSQEEESRNCRYRAVARILGSDEMYLTAHHAEDQAETLFLNLLRGSGVEGIAGIPALRNLGHGWVARPLLEQRRQELVDYLAQRSISWLTDPSNEDTAFDRNYLRHELFPTLEKRWPGLVPRLVRTARNARSTVNAMADFIENQSGDLINDRLKMSLHKLLVLDPEMQGLILRQWLRRHEVPMLTEARLREFLGQLAAAPADSRAEVQWGDWMIKHYRHDLWLHRRAPYVACPQEAWSSGMQLDLGPDSGMLLLSGEPAVLPSGWIVRTRQAEDRIRMRPNGPSHRIKHFFQSAGIPPWLRPAIPVLEWDGEAVALGDWALGHRLQMWLVENSLEWVWQPGDSVLARVRSDCQT